MNFLNFILYYELYSVSQKYTPRNVSPLVRRLLLYACMHY